MGENRWLSSNAGIQISPLPEGSAEVIIFLFLWLSCTLFSGVLSQTGEAGSCCISCEVGQGGGICEVCALRNGGKRIKLHAQCDLSADCVCVRVRRAWVAAVNTLSIHPLGGRDAPRCTQRCYPGDELSLFCILFNIFQTFFEWDKRFFCCFTHWGKQCKSLCKRATIIFNNGSSPFRGESQKAGSFHPRAVVPWAGWECTQQDFCVLFVPERKDIFCFLSPPPVLRSLPGLPAPPFAACWK